MIVRRPGDAGSQWLTAGSESHGYRYTGTRTKGQGECAITYESLEMHFGMHCSLFSVTFHTLRHEYMD